MSESISWILFYFQDALAKLFNGVSHEENPFMNCMFVRKVFFGLIFIGGI
jgi:hypothetical protein